MSDSNLRSSLIRLASANPEFRKDLLPMLKEAAPVLRFTFKDQPKERGLARAVGNPVGSDLKLNGKVIGGVSSSIRYADANRRWSGYFHDPEGKRVSFIMKPDVDRDAAKAYLLKKATEAYSTPPADPAGKP